MKQEEIEPLLEKYEESLRRCLLIATSDYYKANNIYFIRPVITRNIADLMKTVNMNYTNPSRKMYIETCYYMSDPFFLFNRIDTMFKHNCISPHVYKLSTDDYRNVHMICANEARSVNQEL